MPSIIDQKNKKNRKWGGRMLTHVLERLKKNDLHLNLEKCIFEQKHLDFLGVHIEGGSVQMEQSKVNHIQNWIRPRNI